jgi:hypothetical protein
MAQMEISVLIDGIVSIGTHNSVHRIVCYRLTAENKPEPAIELIIPAASLPGFLTALTRLSDAPVAQPTSPPGASPSRAAPAGASQSARAKKETF